MVCAMAQCISMSDLGAALRDVAQARANIRTASVHGQQKECAVDEQSRKRKREQCSSVASTVADAGKTCASQRPCARGSVKVRDECWPSMSWSVARHVVFGLLSRRKQRLLSVFG